MFERFGLSEEVASGLACSLRIEVTGSRAVIPTGGSDCSRGLSGGGFWAALANLACSSRLAEGSVVVDAGLEEPFSAARVFSLDSDIGEGCVFRRRCLDSDPASSTGVLDELVVFFVLCLPDGSLHGTGGSFS